MARGKPATFYNRQIYDLERQLAAKQAQLASLHQERVLLQSKAACLQRQCCAIGAGVAAIRSVIEAGPDGCGGCGGGASAVLQADASDERLDDATPTWEAAIEATLFPMLASAGSGDSATLAMLGQVAAKECGIQRTLSMLSSGSTAGSPPALQRTDSMRSSTSSDGVSGSPTSSRRHGLLYTSQLLAGLLAEPARLARLRSMPLTQRLAQLASAVRQLGFLLPRYDGAPLSVLCTKAVVDDLVDAQVEAALVQGLLCGPRGALVQGLSINMQQQQQQPCSALSPAGWWQQVAMAIALSDEQRLPLRMCWLRIRRDREALLAQHQALARELLLLQHAQAAALRRWEAQATELFESHDTQLAARRAMLAAAAAANGADAMCAQLQRPHPPWPLNVFAAPALGGDAGWGYSTAVAPRTIAAEEHGSERRRLAPSCCAATDAGVCDVHLLGDVCSPEQQALEARMAAVMGRVSLLYALQALVTFNTLSKKQLATAMVHSYPFALDPIALCDALDELGW